MEPGKARWKVMVVCLGWIGLLVMPAQAANLDDVIKITGFIDNHIRWIDNISTNEEDPGNGNLTTDDDSEFAG